MKASDFSKRFVRTPVVLQMEAAECGAAALGIVLGYFGRYVPLGELRTACCVSREGSKASHLLSAARNLGLSARGLRGEVDAMKDVVLPVIIYWNFNHFVVLEGWERGGKSFFLNDPACGRREVGAEEFHRCFTGVILSFSPGPGFIKSPSGSVLRRKLREELVAAPWLWVFVTLCAALLVFPGLAVAGLIRIFVDQYLIDGESHWLLPIVAGLVLSAIVQVSLTGLQQSVLARWQWERTGKETSRFFLRLLHLPMDWFAGRTSGEMAGRLFLPAKISGTVASTVAPVVLGLLPMFGLAAMMLVYDLRMGVLGIVFSAGSLLAVVLSGRDRAGEHQNIKHMEGTFAASAIHGLMVIEHLKCGGREGFLRRLGNLLTRIRNQRQCLDASKQLAGVVPSVLSVCGLAVLVTLGGFHILAGHLTVGELVAIIVLWLQMQILVQGWLKIPALIQDLEASQVRLHDLPETAAAPSRLETSASFGKLEVKNLTFGYSQSSGPILAEISFVLEPGKQVVLTGASGAGKSTLVKLICGHFRPWSGEVLLNGNVVSPVALAGCAAVVEQELVFFQDTVEANLRLGNPGANLSQSLAVTGLDTVLATRPNELLVDNAGNFSGGQRQRLDIARALSRKPGLLILDEAFSGLDAGAAAVIASEFRRLGCAVFQISHRREVLRMADEILVMDSGRIVERGTYSGLSQTGLVFKSLLDL